MTELDITCSDCMALPGVACNWGDVTDHPEFHAARVDAAQFENSLHASNPALATVMPVTDKVLEETGLF